MNTPICDFVREYAAQNPRRLHMPGHKGKGFLGIEHLDITEIRGADSLYEAQGIIMESEKNASRLFGCETFYSAEGSSQCIRAMLWLASAHAQNKGKKLRIAAGRNAHKTFLSAAALLDAEVSWICPEENGSYLSCRPSAKQIDAMLSAENETTAVYLTSPDYLGNLADIRGIAEVCHKHGVLLLVDNAHGAYLRFLPQSVHPMDLGADLCCDSAHKTLPVLTGGAYLHIADEEMAKFAKKALGLFGSTSPSYLILQSLDAANEYLTEKFPEQLREFLPQVEETKKCLMARGYSFEGDEPLKLTICTKSYGYTGTELAALLEEQNIFCEFADPDYLVMMLSAEGGRETLDLLEKALCSLPERNPITEEPPKFALPEKVMEIREALLSAGEKLPVKECIGRILSDASVGCPPAVPVIMCGERIDEAAAECFAYYGIEECCVVKE